MRTILWVFFAASLLLFVGCAASEPVSEKVQACLDKAESPCKISAEKACEDKSGFAKKACESTAKESCMAAANKSCEEK